MADGIDPLIDELPSRFVVGIDLGTTNSAVTYVDTLEAPWKIRVLLIPQYVSATETEPLDTLPSFYYQPPKGTASFDHAIGAYARDETARTSGRGIASAKSWLCHSAVDRTASILPWHGADDLKRMSPVEVSASFLRHIREAWDKQFPGEPLARQDIVLTLPASFDEVARELTIEAAHQAQLPRIVLIEEPQAAFYAWVYKHEQDWDQRVEVGQKILVCDIGGGTTDFTLIRVRKSEVDSQAETSSRSASNQQGTRIQFHRIAVGNHLILGGDNLDLAIARFLEQKLSGGKKLEAYQWDVLVGTSRGIKENLLSDGGPEIVTVNLPGRGSKLIGGGLQTQVTRNEIRDLIVEGFLPKVSLTEKPIQVQSGFQELGLPYASDPAISRSLGHFLLSHADAGEEIVLDEPTDLRNEEQRKRRARPDVILFNGGFFASPVLRERAVEQIKIWFRTPVEPDWAPVVLENDRLDLAVARGAAYYGMVRRNQGVRIAATLARSYYIGIGGEPPQAVCIMPGSAEPGQVFSLSNRPFQLTVSQPVEFSLYVSSLRLADQPGLLVNVDADQWSALPPIRTVLRTKSKNEKGDLPVHLNIGLTELGTIDLSCHEVDSTRSWKLNFDVRSTTQTDIAQHQGAGEAEGVFDDETWNECERIIGSTFSNADISGPNPGDVAGKTDPRLLVKEIGDAIGLPREEWPMSLLRRIWTALMAMEVGRRQSSQHESRWLNLLGFSLRPGYGVALDDWRVTETWRHVHGKLHHQGQGTRNELLILWRRLAGGLTRGQQQVIAEYWLAAMRATAKQTTGKPVKGTVTPLRPEESIEVWRLLGSLELLNIEQKRELGELAVALKDKPKLEIAREAMVWALGRLGQRTPFYGPLNTVVPNHIAEGWINALTEQKSSHSVDHLAVTQMARRTDDRYRDISAEMRARVSQWLATSSASEHLIKLVQECGRFDAEEQGKLFGESLPPGLRLE